MSDNSKKRKPKKGNASPGPLAELRQKAEKRLKAEAGRLRDLSSSDLKKLVHELGTHQIELEMQNEELRRAQAELEASHVKYADLYDFSPVGYFTFDKQGLIRELNLTGAAMLGMEKRFLLNKPILSYIETAHRAVFRDHLSTVFGTQAGASCEITVLKRGGAAFPAELHSLSFRMEEGEPGVCRTSMSDVTERKRAEEEVRRLNEDVKRSLLETEVVNKELEAFSYSVSHDLRAPLRSIEGFTNAILEDCAGVLDETCRGHFNRVVSASRRMNQLIEALLNMARLTKSELREKSVDLSGLAEVIIHELRKKEPERQVEVVIAPGLKARGDTDMLRTALENLLDNAWKFSSRHPGAKIEFGAAESGGGTVYFVRDDGAGFDMQYADKLFQPFRRIHAGSDFPGLGIGLAIAHRIIARHGGRIWAEGEVEKGATFSFTL